MITYKNKKTNKTNKTNKGNKTNKTNKGNIYIARKDNLKVLSYNISWESMSGAKKDWALCSNNDNPNNPKHSSVCVSNIAKVINNNPTDFIILQEATDYNKLLDECPILNKMKYKVHKSGLDVVITFWDAKYKMVDSLEGEFEKGRPWLAIMFNNGLCFINVHFGHYDSIEEYKKLENVIKIITARMSTSKTKINRFIIAGDFNYDIKDFGNNKGIINLDGNRFYHHPKHMLTCCVSRRRHYDHVIDTFGMPIDIFIPNVEYMASDHKPIIAILNPNI
jgi:endonuclease/exonuclease/phosphatase family metal-dependent hydrolase